MLTEKHLVVVQAALKFMDEENSPHGSKALVHYLGTDHRSGRVTIDDLVSAREFFASAELSYALVDSSGTLIESERLLPASSMQELNFHSDLSLLASVLVPFH